MKKKYINPFTIIVGWLVSCFVFTVTLMFILSLTTVGGEQWPLRFLVIMIYIFVYGVLVLSISTAFFYKTWVKKWWFNNLCFFLLCILFIWKDIDQRKNESLYPTSIITLKEDNDEQYFKKIEYYDRNTNKIRSIGYLKNGMKDSVLVTYDERGNVIKQEVFKNDVLIKTIK